MLLKAYDWSSQVFIVLCSGLNMVYWNAYVLMDEASAKMRLKPIAQH